MVLGRREVVHGAADDDWREAERDEDAVLRRAHHVLLVDADGALEDERVEGRGREAVRDVEEQRRGEEDGAERRVEGRPDLRVALREHGGDARGLQELEDVERADGVARLAVAAEDVLPQRLEEPEGRERVARRDVAPVVVRGEDDDRADLPAEALVDAEQVAEEDLQEQLLAHAEEAAVRARDRLGGGDVVEAAHGDAAVVALEVRVAREARRHEREDDEPPGGHDGRRERLLEHDRPDALRHGEARARDRGPEHEAQAHERLVHGQVPDAVLRRRVAHERQVRVVHAARLEAHDEAREQEAVERRLAGQPRGRDDREEAVARAHEAGLQHVGRPHGAAVVGGPEVERDDGAARVARHDDAALQQRRAVVGGDGH